MRQAILLAISLILGWCLTLGFYANGGAFVRPGLFLARLVATDRGGDSLLFLFAVMNTALCAALIFVGLSWVAGRLLASR